MSKNLRKNILWMLLGSLITILLISGYTFFTSYEKAFDQTAAPLVKYKHQSKGTYLSATVRDYLTIGDRSLYFGELPAKESALEIIIPFEATVLVYPFDKDTVIIRYEPHCGISRTYKKSGYGDFNRILKSLYEHTNMEVFNETIDYSTLNN